MKLSRYSARALFRLGLVSTLVLIAAAVASVATADEVTVIEKHKAKVIIAGDGSSDVFEIDDELEVGESRQFFTDDGKEIVILRTEEGLEVSIDGETTTAGVTKLRLPHDCEGDCNQLHIDSASSVKVIHMGGADDDGEKTRIQLIRRDDGHPSGDGDVKVIRLGSGANQEIEIDEKGRKMVFISTGDHDADHDGDHVWISSDDAQAYSFTLGDGSSALEHLKTSGALDKLDEETREKVLEALGDLEEEAQSP